MIELTERQATNLRIWNIGLTVLHTAQAVLIVVLASSFSIAINTSSPS